MQLLSAAHFVASVASEHWLCAEAAAISCNATRPAKTFALLHRIAIAVSQFAAAAR